MAEILENPESVRLSDVNPLHLPPRLKEIADVVGMVGMEKLVSVHGGTRFYVPVSVDGQHPLSKLLGLELAEKLVKHFGGTNDDLPKGQIALKALINQRIRADREAGCLVVDLARRYKITDRHVRNIVPTFSNKKKTKSYPEESTWINGVPPKR